MATPATNPTYTEAQRALQQEIANFETKLSNPSVSEPFRGAFHFAARSALDQKLDANYCRVAGKVVHVVALVPKEVQDPITLRGSQTPLSWDKDLAADESFSYNEPNAKTFTFHIPTDRMNDQIQFKLCRITPNDVLWSSGDNWTINLQEKGHITKMDLGAVSFS